MAEGARINPKIFLEFPGIRIDPTGINGYYLDMASETRPTDTPNEDETMISKNTNLTIEEATAAADAVYEVKSKGTGQYKTIFLRAIEEDDEWEIEALETTIRGGVATLGGWPDRGYDDRAEAIAKIEPTVQSRGYGSVRKVK